jgi:dethiobiotin synthetase
VSAAVVAVLRARGASVRALKPVITGLVAPPDPVWAARSCAVASLEGEAPDEVAPIRFAAAVSPHLAAELTARRSIRTRSHARWLDAQDAAQRARTRS